MGPLFRATLSSEELSGTAGLWLQSVQEAGCPQAQRYSIIKLHLHPESTAFIPLVLDDVAIYVFIN